MRTKLSHIVFALMLVFGMTMANTLAAKAEPAPPNSDPISITIGQNGTNGDGTCGSFQEDPEVSPGPGQQAWHLIATGTNLNGGSVTLDASFADGTTVSGASPSKVTPGGVAHWYVITSAGTSILSATASYSGGATHDANANLNVSHCVEGTEPPPPPPPTDPTCDGLALVPSAGDVPYSLDATISYTDPDAQITSFKISWGDGSGDYTGTLPSASHQVSTAGSWTATAYLQTAEGEISGEACTATYSGTLPPPPPPGEASADARALACAPSGGAGQVYLVANHATLKINGEAVHDGNLTVSWPAGTYVGTATADTGYLFTGGTSEKTITVTVGVCETPPPEVVPPTGLGGAPDVTNNVWWIILLAVIVVIGGSVLTLRRRHA